MIGFAVGGAFLGLSYFDLYYHLIAIIVVLRAIVAGELEAAGEVPAPAANDGVAEPTSQATAG
jgi:hypothetical protein